MTTRLTEREGAASAALSRLGASASPLLSVRGLSKAFTGTLALDAVDLEVMPGEIHALLGENGSGKSTLIKILSGYHEPDAGTVGVAGQELDFGRPERSSAQGCRFIHQDLGLVDTMSVLDNLLMSSGYPKSFGTVRDRVARSEVAADLDRVGLEVDPRTMVARLSPAEKTGVAVARALRPDPDNEIHLLVLDEPTATLPESEVQHLLDIVRRVAATGVAILYVTHRLEEVGEIADNLTVLRDGKKVTSAPARGLSRRDLIQLLVGSEFDDVHAVSSKLRPSERPVLGVEGLVAGPLAGVTFDAYAGEVIGVAGVTGSGRETLLSTIFGGTARESGRVAVGDRDVPSHKPAASVEAGMGYLPADRKKHGGMMEHSARENLTLADVKSVWRAPFVRRKLENAEAKRWFEQLSVRPADRFDQQLIRFSGGNQQKVLLAKWLRREPTVLLLDEPTQGVDVHSKTEIHRQLIAEAQRGATVVIASSDVEELAAACTRVLVLRSGRIVADLDGSDVAVPRISREALGTDLVGSTT